MAFTFKPNRVKLRTEDGTYTSPIVIGDASTAEQIAELEAAIDQMESTTIENITQIGNEIETKGQQTLDSIPDDYQELSGEVTELKSQIKEYRQTKTELSSYIVSGYVKADGSIQAHSSYITFDNVPVIGGKTYALYHKIISTSDGYRYCIKGATKTVLPGGSAKYGSNKLTQLNLSNEASFISFSVYASETDVYISLLTFDKDLYNNFVLPYKDEQRRKEGNQFSLTPFVINNISFTDGGYIDSTGEPVSYAGYSYSDEYIDIHFAQYVKTPSFLGSGARIAFYNASKVKTKVVEGGTYGSLLEIETEGAYYMRISCYTSKKSEIFVATDGIFNSIQNISTQLENVFGDVEFTTTFTDGYFLDQSGEAIAYNGYSYTDYINVRIIESIKFPAYFQTGAKAWFYDENYGKITPAISNTDPVGTIKTLNIPNGAAYIRISCYTSYKSSFYAHGYINYRKTVYEIPATIDSVPLKQIIKDGGMVKIFKTMGVVGDSLSSGAMVYQGQDEQQFLGVDMYEYSWIQQMSRYCGNIAYNFSTSGLSTRTFLSNTGGCYAKMLDSNYFCQAYFIALGHNDKNQSIPVGTADDIGSDSAQTYYKYYAQIISEIQRVVPDAKIFCVCMKNGQNDPTFADYNTAIKYMPTVFDNVYVLDMHEYCPNIYGWEYTNGHGNAMGYLNYSYQLSSYVDWIIRHNTEDFKYVQFIGTDIPYAE